MTYRLRVLPRFPANISGAVGITVEREGVDLVVKPDYGALTQVPSVIDPDTNFFTVWNEDDDMYVRMSFGDVFDAVSGLGFMQTEVYDPQAIGADAFDRANHTGTNTPSDGTVTTAKIVDANVTTPKIADANVTTAKIADSAITSAKIADGTIAAADISSSFIADLKWLSKAVGEFYEADDGVAGVDIPPSSTSGSTVWVELTSGLTGSGLFNENKLTSESVSGSAPLVLATAVVSLSGSPMNGQTIRLLNTERRIRRAGSVGTLENDAFQGHIHDTGLEVSNTGGTGSAARTTTGSRNTTTPLNDGTNGTPRTANETRMKNIGVRVFRRIK